MESEAITVYLAFVLEELQLLKINICMCVAKCDWCVSISMYTRLCLRMKIISSRVSGQRVISIFLVLRKSRTFLSASMVG